MVKRTPPVSIEDVEEAPQRGSSLPLFVEKRRMVENYVQIIWYLYFFFSFLAITPFLKVKIQFVF